MDEIESLGRLSPEAMEALKELYNLQSNLVMPTIKIQSDSYRSEWYRLTANIRESINSVSLDGKFPAEFDLESLKQRTIKLLAQTEISNFEDLKKNKSIDDVDKDV